MTQHLHRPRLTFRLRRSPIRFNLTVIALTLGLIEIGGNAAARTASALPPPEDVPEEIRRAEIILEARSPIDGEPLTAAEYAELQSNLADSVYPPTLSSDVQQFIFLLQMRRALRTLIPPTRLLDF